MAGYVITKTYSRKSAEKTKRHFENRGVPVEIRKINDSRFLIVAARNYIDQIRHIRVAGR